MEAYELDKIKVLATSFRGAIEIAKDAGEFDNDFAFPRFPKGCCGDTSDLLAEYLAQHDIYTYYVCGQKGTQSHAWLVLVNTVTVTTDNSDADRKYKSLISVYNEDNDVMLLRKYYNLKDAIIIDITGDQFTNQKCFLYYNIPVYVGFLDDFHNLFRVDQCSIHEPARLWDARCKSLYRAITKYIKQAIGLIQNGYLIENSMVSLSLISPLLSTALTLKVYFPGNKSLYIT